MLESNGTGDSLPLNLLLFDARKGEDIDGCNCSGASWLSEDEDSGAVLLCTAGGSALADA